MCPAPPNQKRYFTLYIISVLRVMRRESVPLTPVIDSADHRHISYILSKTDKGRNCENSTNFNRSSLKHLVLGQMCKVEKDTFF